MQLSGIDSNQGLIEVEMPLFIDNKYLYRNDIKYESFDYIKKERSISAYQGRTSHLLRTSRSVYI